MRDGQSLGIIPKYTARYSVALLLIILLLSLVSPDADPAAGAEQEVPAQQPEAPSRLAPLGLEKLMDIEVTTVTRTESTVRQSAAAVHVITQEDIRRSGCTTFAELLRRVPGMDVARIDANKWAISARGFTERFGNKLLVQIDGRTVYNPVFTGVFWDIVDYPLEDVERVEVVRGPGASVWGANAVNGVVNIITKSSQETQAGMLSAGAGTEEKKFGTLRYGGKAQHDLSYRLYGKAFDRGKEYSASGNPNDQWWGGSTGMRVDHAVSPDDLLTLQGDYIYSVASRRDERPVTTSPYSFVNLEDEKTGDGNVLGRWTRQLGEDSSMSLQTYWEHFRRTSTNQIQYLLYDLFDLDFQHQLSAIQRHRVTYGLGYRLIDSRRRPSQRDNGFILGFDDLTRHTQLFSSFLQDEIALVPHKLTLLLGSKFEHNDHSGFEYQPSARLLWSPTEYHTVWGAVSRAVRTPSIGEDNAFLTLLPFSGTTTFLQFQPSPDLKSEKLWAYELGYRTQPNNLFSLDVALFYNDYHDLRSTSTGTPFTGANGVTLLPVTYENKLSAESYGAELAGTWQLAGWWKLYTAYTYLHLNLHRAAGLPESAEAAENQSPRHQVYLQSSWDIARIVEFDLIGRFVDRLSGFNPAGTPGTSDAVPAYFSMDARLAWVARNDVTVEIVGQNLLEDHHAEFGTSPLILSPPVQIERAVYAKLNWRF